MQLTRYEQETIITFNEAEKEASVYTHNGALRRKLDKLALERPEECRLTSTCHGGQGVDYTVPKSWIRVTPTRIMSEARLEVLRKARLAQKSPVATGDSNHIIPTEGSYTPGTPDSLESADRA